ncbi:MAG TPA: ATP-binding protein [Solirubrobacteraceae bacterium]|nr:ATP-binding protein [Solirubrobacteraceae bacterium]
MPLRRPPLAYGLLAAVASIALTTAIVYPLKTVAAAISLGVVYLLAVLVVAAFWGVWLGVATAVGSALAFNYFHIEPTGRFTIADGENWVALAVLVVASVVVSWLAEAARSRALEAEQRRREADLAAEMARILLRGDDLDSALAVASSRLSSALDLPSASITRAPAAGDDRRVAFPLRDGPSQLGTLLVPSTLPETLLRRLQERVVPSLEALLAAALERDALLADTVETRALRRSDLLKTALLRAVSHDLRTPLTAILTSVEPLASPSLSDGDRRELAAGVGEEASRLARLIDQLLDLSRLEAHAAAPRVDWCSVDEVLRVAMDELGARASFTLAIADDLPLVRADAAQLERAFANLLENSVRHGAGHPVSVRARAVNGRLRVRIVDRGPGIPPAQLDRVFEPFYRSGTDATGHRGSGLGLAIARGFVEVNGGRLWAESLPGQGTSFVVELPLEPVPAAAPEPAPAPAA